VKYSQAKLGRIFILRLEHGDVLHQEIEQFCRQESVRAAALIVLGGADKGSELVVGPERQDRSPIVTLVETLDAVHEVAGVGTVFWDKETDAPATHIHVAAGRGTSTHTGCVRRGVRVWQTIEIVLWELTDSTATRVLDPELGFKLLMP
jgi:predicted DNA-binding protein with PD1-like motif